MSALAALGGVTGLSAATIAANSAGGGPDLIGIAAVITAISGLIATVGMLYLNIRRGRDVIREDITKAVHDGLAQGGRDET